MASELCFYEKCIICPKCERIFEAYFVRDIDYGKFPVASEGLAGGNATCPACGYVVFNDEVDVIEIWEMTDAQKKELGIED